MGSNAIGEIPVLITGDYSGLIADLQIAENLAAQGATQIGASFTSAARGSLDLDEAIKLLTADGLEFDTTTKTTTQDVTSFAEVLKNAAAATDQVGQSASSASKPIADVAGASDQVSSSASDATQGLKSMADQLLAVAEALAVTEALREFGQEALTAYDSVQRATNSLTALTGGAQQAEQVLTAIRSIAETQPFSFPELAGSAQRLAAFGITAEQIPKVLQDAANASRATGNSFDSIAAALGRIDIQGQLTGRQLYQLGISWDDLAKSAGRSVEDTQAILKKGGQSAADDLTLVLKTIEDKFGGFSKVPLSIGEEWIVLQNKITTVMQGVGQAILPVISQIIDVIGGTLIPLIKSASEAFNSLPAPVKDAAVAFALIVSATAPLAAGVGAIGLAMSGLSALIVPVTSALSALGITATTTATAVVAAEQAIGSGGIAGAATGATAAVGGLASALGAVALALGTFGGAAAVTLSDIDSLRNKWNDFVADSNKEKIFRYIEEGATSQQIKAVGISVDELKTSLQSANKEIDYGNTTLDTFGNVVLVASGKIKAAAAAVDDFGYKVKILSDTVPGLSQVSLDLIDKQNKLEATAKTLGASYQELKDRQDGVTVTASDVLRAYKEWQSALQAADAGVKSHVLSMSDLITKNSQLNSELKTAQSVYDQVTARVDAGTVSANLQSEALKQLQKAHKALNDTELDSQTLNKITEENAQTLIDKTLAQVTATQQMIDAWGADDLAVQQSVAARDALLSKMNLTAGQFQQLIPLITAAKEAGVDLDGHLATLGNSFKTLGITAEATLKDTADKFKIAADAISAAHDKISADGVAAWGKWSDAAKKAADGLSVVQTAAHEMGITTVADLTYMRDKYVALINDMRASGEGGWDAIRAAEQKVKDLDDEILAQTSPLIQAYKTLGIQSAETLQKDLDQKKAALDLIQQTGAGIGTLQAAQDSVNKAMDKYQQALYGATTAHQGLNTAAAQLPPILNADVTTLEKVNALIVQAGTATKEWATFAEQVSAATDQANKDIASFDAAADARMRANASGGSFAGGQFFGAGITQATGSAGAEGGGIINVPNPIFTGGLTGTPFGAAKNEPPTTTGTSTPTATTTPSAALPTSDQIAAINAQLQQMFSDMADAGQVDVTQLNALASTIGEFVTVDATGLHIAWQQATTAATSTATANQTLTTAATNAAAGITSFSDGTATAVAAITPLPPVLAAFGTAVVQNTDAINAELQARQSIVDSLNQWIDQFNAQNANTLASAFQGNPNQRFLATVPLSHIPAAAPLGTSSQQILGGGTYITVNNPVVRDQNMLDQMIQQLKNVGV